MQRYTNYSYQFTSPCCLVGCNSYRQSLTGRVGLKWGYLCLNRCDHFYVVEARNPFGVPLKRFLKQVLK